MSRDVSDVVAAVKDEVAVLIPNAEGASAVAKELIEVAIAIGIAEGIGNVKTTQVFISLQFCRVGEGFGVEDDFFVANAVLFVEDCAFFQNPLGRHRGGGGRRLRWR